MEPDPEWEDRPCWRSVELITKDGTLTNHLVFAANNKEAMLQVCAGRIHEIAELWAEPVEEDPPDYPADTPSLDLLLSK